MSDVLTVGLTVVVVWALYLARDIVLRGMRLKVDERDAIRKEQLFERAEGFVAKLNQRVEACEKAVSDMRTEQKTFLANARGR